MTQRTTHPDRSRGATSGGSERRSGHSCLVVGYDGTDASDCAIAWAVGQLASDGRLVIVHACRALHAPSSPLTSERERRDLGRALLEEVCIDRGQANGDMLVHAEVADEDPVRALNRVGERCHADGIVVGHGSHSRLHRAIGTVTGELLARCTVPVTVVPCGPPGAGRSPA